MNITPAVRSDVVVDNFQSFIARYVASGRLRNLVQDYVEVYDVPHQASNIFLAGEQESC